MKGETITVNTGSVIYSPFSTNGEVFVIKLGYVIAYTYENNGKQRIHLIYGPGSYFPVITTFKNTEQRASYESITQVVAVKYRRRDFLKELKTSRDFSNQILEKTVEQLSIFADIVVNLQVTKLEDKLLNRLKNLAKAHGIADKVIVTLPYKLKHHHLSDMLGAERESVSRALNILKKKRLIAVNARGFITISIKA